MAMPYSQSNSSVLVGCFHSPVKKTEVDKTIYTLVHTFFLSFPFPLSRLYTHHSHHFARFLHREYRCRRHARFHHFTFRLRPGIPFPVKSHLDRRLLCRPSLCLHRMPFQVLLLPRCHVCFGGVFVFSGDTSSAYSH